MALSTDSHNVTGGRSASIAIAIQKYQSKYNANGSNDEQDPFYIAPIISIKASGDEIYSGISVRARQAIPRGTIVMSVPSDARKKPIPEVGCLEHLYVAGDFTMAVAIMHLVAKDDIVAATWPSVEEVRATCYPIWYCNSSSFNLKSNPGNASINDLLKGTYTLDTLTRFEMALRFGYDEIVRPILEESENYQELFLPPSARQTEDNASNDKDNLWEAFLYASSLVRSRSHEGRDGDSPEIIPIIDLINGFPSSLADRLNVVLSGPNQCRGGVKSSQIVTMKDIAAGEELFLSYGNLRASFFVIRYACCPPEFVRNPIVSFDPVRLQVPKYLAPKDALRIQACQQSGYPWTPEMIEKDFGFFLPYDALLNYRQTPPYQGETEQLKSMRQFLILTHLLDDEAVKINMSTGRLRAACDPRHLGFLHLLVLDYTMTEYCSLNTSNNNDDLDHATSCEANHFSLATAYRVRVCQRDSLALWRHAICNKYGLPSEHVMTENEYAGFQVFVNMARPSIPGLPKSEAPRCLMATKGCHVCGRTIFLKACSKCKVVKYCGREHQLADWKMGHKKICKAAV